MSDPAGRDLLTTAASYNTLTHTGLERVCVGTTLTKLASGLTSC